MPERFFTADQFTSNAGRSSVRARNSGIIPHMTSNSTRNKSRQKPSPPANVPIQRLSSSREETILTQPGSETRPPRITRPDRPRLSRSFDDSMQTPVRRAPSNQGNSGRKSNRSLENTNGARRKVRVCYDDGGPGPDEPKTVLPEPLRNY